MIPVCEPLIGEQETALVLDCMKTGWVSSAGKYIDRFEKEWAAYCGMSHGVAVCNGSAALDVAVGLLDLQAGDEVIMPTFTIISPAQSVVRQGGVPVLVDTDPRNWQMDVAQVAAKVTPRTRAIMVVHIYGHPVDMDPILALAKEHGLLVVEDAAEVHGAEYKGHRCGGLGDISTFSFFANKLITTGEGGMVLTKRDDHAERARSLRNLCFVRERRFFHEALGYNMRMTNIQAAMGVGQLQRLGSTIERKRAIAAKYRARLGRVPGLEMAVEEPWAKNVYWVVGAVLPDELGVDAAEVSRRMAARGIETRPFFLGMHEQPVFRRMGLFNDEHHPVAERLARRGLYLPNGLALTDAQIDESCDAFERAIA